jgi:hypothetical protein
MLQWKYRTIDLGDVPRKVDEIDLLDEAGEEGWELIAISVNIIAFQDRVFEQPGPRRPGRASCHRRHGRRCGHLHAR